MSAILNRPFWIFWENLTSNSLSATSKTSGYEILNYWTDIKICATKCIDWRFNEFWLLWLPISLKPIIDSTWKFVVIDVSLQAITWHTIHTIQFQNGTKNGLKTTDFAITLSSTLNLANSSKMRVKLWSSVCEASCRSMTI